MSVIRTFVWSAHRAVSKEVVNIRFEPDVVQAVVLAHGSSKEDINGDEQNHVIDIVVSSDSLEVVMKQAILSTKVSLTKIYD